MTLTATDPHADGGTDGLQTAMQTPPQTATDAYAHTHPLNPLGLSPSLSGARPVEVGEVLTRDGRSAAAPPLRAGAACTACPPAPSLAPRLRSLNEPPWPGYVPGVGKVGRPSVSQAMAAASPAHLKGLTIRAASLVFGLPEPVVRHAFIYGLGEQGGPVGQRDSWDVWFAERAAAEAVFGSEPRPDPTEPLHVKRAREKLARYRAGRGG